MNGYAALASALPCGEKQVSKAGTAFRKGVRNMKYRITRAFTVDASSKQEALEKLKAKQAEYLDYESIKEVPEGGWGQAFRRQVTGK